MIVVEDLSYTYARADRAAISGLRFEVRRGEIFGFLGPNGAGKSTTQKILIGLLRRYQGGVSVIGRDLAAWRADYYERIGVSFEFPNHFLKLTGRENLAYFRSLYQGETLPPETLLDWVDLAGDGDMLVSHYSKGMKTRLGIARSMLNDPELIFMDEPTTGLDPVGARRIKDLVKSRQADGKTVFLTTHDMAVADELCDRVALIVDGQIKLIDTPRELRLRYGRPRVRVEYRDDHRIEAREFPLEGLGDSAEFLSLLRQGDVQTLHTQEATMEDVFIEVTGRSLQ
ncbi:MAG: ABC transporter ATP-binding protein [Planctomycetota bacterium]|jgi:fluoroquinolone transport system ATP-binding protein